MTSRTSPDSIAPLSRGGQGALAVGPAGVARRPPAVATPPRTAAAKETQPAARTRFRPGIGLVTGVVFGVMGGVLATVLSMMAPDVGPWRETGTVFMVLGVMMGAGLGRGIDAIASCVHGPAPGDTAPSAGEEAR